VLTAEINRTGYDMPTWSYCPRCLDRSSRENTWDFSGCVEIPRDHILYA